MSSKAVGLVVAIAMSVMGATCVLPPGQSQPPQTPTVRPTGSVGESATTAASPPSPTSAARPGSPETRPTVQEPETSSTESPIATRPAQSSQPNGRRRLTEAQLNGAEYTVCGERLRLTDGAGMTGKPGLDYARQCKARVERIVFGDLDGDGFEDAAVVLYVYERSHQIPSAHAMVDSAGQPVEAAYREWSSTDALSGAGPGAVPPELQPRVGAPRGRQAGLRPRRVRGAPGIETGMRCPLRVIAMARGARGSVSRAGTTSSARTASRTYLR